MKTHQRWRESLNEKMYFVNVVSAKAYGAGNSHHAHFKEVNFQYAAPGVRTVHLVGDFNRWHPILMQPREGKCWFIRLWLPHGQHRYRFLADGKPVLDPSGPGIGRDEHNEPVSLLVVD